MDQRTIPEDLREQYELHKKWLAIPWHERPRSGSDVEAILRENSVNDIERIALAESQAAELRGEVERLKSYQANYEHATKIEREEMQAALERQQRAVTDEEWDAISDYAGHCVEESVTRADLNKFLASRSREQEPG